MGFYQLNSSHKEAEASLYESSELSLCEVEEMHCEIEDTTDIMDMDMDMDVSSASSAMDIDSDDENDGNDDDDDDDDGGGGGEIPFHTLHSHTTLQQSQNQKRKRNMLIPVAVNPTPTAISANSVTPRITRPRGFFRREPISVPVMRLREKWKESVSIRAESALWSGFEFGNGFGFGVIQTGSGTGSVGGAEFGRGPGRKQVRFYRGREVGVNHGLPY
ncbi:uncharacterized protein EURHEDRAFT_382149 [Aspergillus ruber CBS 135680]|uniref:Uncharacterized protein n=1 Tax=Aspergillus ruber (strain CBS 135680) TaxID=1388766 RepID=A0A017S220_ASPRC|nr:uncharacterized protein EURHEDRAFT_382149 [Aspergillus ruber CBS 135680]EYE90215.1 hypothetical protein EURHEDRAFT_382149 [Aspergillus ruber CBS 135680]